MTFLIYVQLYFFNKKKHKNVRLCALFSYSFEKKPNEKIYPMFNAGSERRLIEKSFLWLIKYTQEKLLALNNVVEGRITLQFHPQAHKIWSNASQILNNILSKLMKKINPVARNFSLKIIFIILMYFHFCFQT